MSNTEYDKNNNVLKITKNTEGASNPVSSSINNAVNSPVNNSPVNQVNTSQEATVQAQNQTRGFLFIVADNEEQLKDYESGRPSQIHMMPALADTKEKAMEVIRSQGKIPVAVFDYELLSLKKKLIEDLAKSQNIVLIEEKIFDIKQM